MREHVGRAQGLNRISLSFRGGSTCERCIECAAISRASLKNDCAGVHKPRPDFQQQRRAREAARRRGVRANEPRVSSANELEAPDGRPPSPCAPSCSSLVARRTYAVRWVPAQTSASRALPFSGCGLTGGLPIASRTPSGGPCERARRAFASISARRKGSKRWRRGADNVRRSENDGVPEALV